MKHLVNLPELELLAQALEFTGPGLRISARVEAYSAKALAQERQLFKRLDAALQAELLTVSPPDHGTDQATSFSPVGSAFGPLDSRASRKTFGLLIATLNLAYPDHEFGSVRPDEFVREPSVATVLSSLSSALSHLRAHQTGSPMFQLGLSGGQSSIFRSFASYPSSPPKVPVNLPTPTSYSSSTESETSSGSASTVGPSRAAPLHPFFRQVLDPIIDLDECEVYSYQPEIESDPHADDDDASSTEGDDDLEGYLDDLEYDEVQDALMQSDTDSDFESSGHWRMDGLSYAPSTPRRPRSRHSSTPRDAVYVSNAPKRTFSTLSIADTEPRSRAHGGLLWSSNWFFYHRASKRILFITLWARTRRSMMLPPVQTPLPIPLSVCAQAVFGTAPIHPTPAHVSAILPTPPKPVSPVRKRMKT